MISLGERRDAGDWRPPVVKLVAMRGEGIDELVEALDKHHAWADETGELRRRRRQRVAGEIEAITLAALRERIGDLHDSGADEGLAELADRVLAGDTDPYSASDTLLERITSG